MKNYFGLDPHPSDEYLFVAIVSYEMDERDGRRGAERRARFLEKVQQFRRAWDTLQEVDQSSFKVLVEMISEHKYAEGEFDNEAKS